MDYEGGTVWKIEAFCFQQKILTLITSFLLKILVNFIPFYLFGHILLGLEKPECKFQ